MLDVKGSPATMSSTLSNTTELDSTNASNESSMDAFDINPQFDRWLQDLQGGQKPLAPDAMETHEEEGSEIFIRTFSDPTCEGSIEGLLLFDGYLIGNISSPEGTLVLSKRGRIEADINVGVALINGSVTGNIAASERVVLESGARVSGQIRTPTLWLRLGAVFDGECLLAAVPEPVDLEESSDKRQSEDLEYLAVGAGV